MFFTLSKDGKQQYLFQYHTNFYTRKLLNLVYKHKLYFDTYVICDVLMKKDPKNNILQNLHNFILMNIEKFFYT